MTGWVPVLGIAGGWTLAAWRGRVRWLCADARAHPVVTAVAVGTFSGHIFWPLVKPLIGRLIRRR